MYANSCLTVYSTDFLARQQKNRGNFEYEVKFYLFLNSNFTWFNYYFIFIIFLARSNIKLTNEQMEF